MTKIIAPTESEVEAITLEQIGRLADRFITKCRKNPERLPRAAVQGVLTHESDKLVDEMYWAFVKRVERRSQMVVRRVTVNRDLSPLELAENLVRNDLNSKSSNGRRIDTDRFVTLPSQGSGIEEVKIYFFPTKSKGGIYSWEHELRDVGLEPDYYAQVQANIDDPMLSKQYPNQAQWGLSRGIRSRDSVSVVSFFHGPLNDSDYHDTKKWRSMMSCYQTDDVDHSWIAGCIPKKKSRI